MIYDCFLPKGNAFVSLLFEIKFIFPGPTFLKFSLQASSIINFFSLCFIHKRCTIPSNGFGSPGSMFVYYLTKIAFQILIGSIWIIRNASEVSIFYIRQKISWGGLFVAFINNLFRLNREVRSKIEISNLACFGVKRML